MNANSYGTFKQNLENRNKKKRKSEVEVLSDEIGSEEIKVEWINDVKYTICGIDQDY